VTAVTGYTLAGNYRNLFLADNNTTGAGEFIFAVNFDGMKSRTWGGTTFLCHAPVGGSMQASDHGLDFGWGGIRTTKEFVAKLPDVLDSRRNFYTNGQNLEINDISEFSNGYAVIKFRNKTSTGGNGSNPTWVDTDFPMFRLAEVYLNYAEATLRGGAGGNTTTALNYVNALRTRAYGNTSGNINSAQMTVPYLLDERARELYWEAVRRTDLIRYGQFTEGTYLWAWKGGIQAGRSVANTRKLFPIPSADLVANPNLVQNPGY
jgi:hypothetical protein